MVACLFFTHYYFKHIPLLLFEANIFLAHDVTLSTVQGSEVKAVKPILFLVFIALGINLSELQLCCL